MFDAKFQSLGFRMLTKLELFECTFVSDHEEFVDTFSEFPCLEHLVLDRLSPKGFFDDDKRFRIYGHRLLSLSVTDTYFTVLGINAPKLKYFYFENLWDLVEFKELNLPSRDHAVIWTYDESKSVEDDRTEHEILSLLMSLLHGLSNATTLTLGRSTIELLSDISELLEKQQSPFTRRETLSLEELEVHEAPAVINYFVKGGSLGTKPVVSLNDR